MRFGVRTAATLIFGGVFGICLGAAPLGHGTAFALSQSTIVSPDGMTPPPAPKDGIRWEELKDVDAPIDPKERPPQFSPGVLSLDGKDVKLRGFMMPLDEAEKQTRFVLTALPPSCPFCLPAGPDQLVEVQCSDGVKFTFDPVTIAGKFEVLRDDPTGLLYRMVDAKRVGD
ncbi:MAG TPA: DUF3299 domain-containing protein [Alphaproteobacteria bacterium]